MNGSGIDVLLSKHRDKGLLIDTNMLLLFEIGRLNRDMIRRFKRTSQYSGADFEVLTRLTALFSRIVTTPHVLTEVNDLMRSGLTEPFREQTALQLAGDLKNWLELYKPALELSREAHFAEFGIADIGIVFAARDGLLVLTDDRKLHGYLASLELASISLEWLRAKQN